MTAPSAPVWVAEVDLTRGGDAPPEGICRGPAPADTGTRLLVRAGRAVLGFVTVGSTDIDDMRAAIAAYTERIGWRRP
jgi:hypothetical protein